MARKCVKFGRSHGRRVCRKFSGKGKGRGKSSKAAMTPGVAHAIKVAGKKACGSPARAEKTQAIASYLRATASVEMNQGVAALGKTAARRRLRGVSRQVLALSRKSKRCIKQMRAA